MAYDLRPLIKANASLALKLGVFRKVNGHEPKNAPGVGLVLSYFLDRIRPVLSSGLNTTSALVVINGRITLPMITEPQDEIDVLLGNAGVALFSAYHQDLTFDGLIRSIDVHGSAGQRLEGVLRYLEQDRRQFRAFVLTVPMIVNDVWPQAQ